MALRRRPLSGHTGTSPKALGATGPSGVDGLVSTSTTGARTTKASWWGMAVGQSPVLSTSPMRMAPPTRSWVARVGISPRKSSARLAELPAEMVDRRRPSARSTSPARSTASCVFSRVGSTPPMQVTLTPNPASSMWGRPAISRATSSSRSGMTPSRRSPASTMRMTR